MTPVDQYLALVSPTAIATAVLSGAAFALVIHALRPTAEARLITFLTFVLSVIWYAGQWAPLFFLDGTGYGTLGRWSLFTFAFIPAMWVTLRWRSRS